MTYTEKEILDILTEVDDPEIPVLNVVEMGIVRNVEFQNENIKIDITPTYSGCPAMKAIENGILDVLYSKGVKNVFIKTIYSPPWTTNWLSEETKLKLKKYGIAPPKEAVERLEKIECPFCNSSNTKLTSEFGSTACKSLHFCKECMQPFEHFKCI
jgi:ring-1,2-phenylacetyl-CoA epoxidase subunit PaaD